MKGIVNYFIRYSISGNVLMIMIVLFGLFGYKSLRTTFFPEIPTRIIQILSVYPGASPEEIEESVVLKVEDNLKGISGVERVTSTSSENTATVLVEIQKGMNIDVILIDVKNAVDQITSFPVGLESIDVFKQESLGRGISLSLSGNEDLYQLKTKARKIERDLLDVKGISKVKLGGYPDEEIVISFDEEQLRRYGLRMDELIPVIRANNLDITGGQVKGREEELRIRARNKKYYAADMKDMVIRTSPDGRIVRLSDVATVEDKWSEVPNKNYYNGQPSVSIDVETTETEDLFFVTDHVKEYVENFNNLNKDLALTVTKDESETVSQRIELLRDNGIMGFLLVLILLAFFLNYRLAFWVAISIPISFAGMFILASMFGITINVITLFGMIMVIGILVDDGVIISENIYRHFEMGKGRIDSAVKGTMEVLPPVFSAVLTTMIVFSSFFFIDGRLGDFFSQMAFIVIATLLFSLIEGIFILPAHVAHSKALNRKIKPGKFQLFTEKIMNFMRLKWYMPVLKWAMRNPVIAISIPVGMFIITTMGAIGGGFIKTTFFPYIERDEIAVTLKMPAGTPEWKTMEVMNQIENGALRANADLKSKRPDSLNVVTSIEKRLGPVNSNQGQMNIQLADNEVRNMKLLEVTNIIRNEVGPIVGIEEINYGTSSPFGKPISIAIQGEDLDEVRVVSAKLKDELNSLSDLKDVTDTDIPGEREINIRLKDKARLLGFTDQSIMAQIRNGYFGGEVQRIQRGLDEIKIWVRYDREERASIENLADMYIYPPNGDGIPLRSLVDLEIERGVVSITHTDGKREIKVEADVGTSEVSVTDLMSGISASILPQILADHPDIKTTMEGQSREQQKSMGSMSKVMPIVFILMIAIILLTFRSVSQTAVVLALIPFSFIGVAWGHFFEQLPISLFSILGMIALIGILVNDALVFVGALNTNIKEGMPYRQALEDAALSRFRPIVLTSVTTVAGLAPLLFEKSFQAQFLIPMAATIAYGLIFSTMITLLLLPTLLMVTNKIKRLGIWYWTNKDLRPIDVEAAFREKKYETNDEV